MKLLNRGLALAVVGAGLAALPTSGVQAAAAPQADENGVTAMKAAASGRALVSANSATDRVGFIRLAGEGDLLPAVEAEDRAGAVAKASSYLDRYATNFGARAAELEQSEVVAGKTGWTVTFEQAYKGVPVFAAELKAHVDTEGDLTSVNGFAVPGLSLSVTPGISGADAAARAVQMVKAKPSGYEDGLPARITDGLVARSTELQVYRMGTTRGIAGESRLAWVVEVWNKTNVREMLVLDAATGKALNRWSMMAHALDRELYEGAYDPDNLVWKEGDPYPGELNDDQSNEILGAAEAYWMFRNTFGYNSWDGNGGKMITVNNDPTINCPNANWNGVTTNYCNGVTGDDTVAHEWGHAYTESTSGLIYQWQAGAMNEAYSDIWGETVDMLNARQNEVGEENAEGGTVYRTPGTCSDYTRQDVTMTITAPESVAGPCTAAPASFGPVFGQTPVTGTAVVGIDAANGTGGDTSPTNGCQPFTNAAAIVAAGWVYVDRGTCSFQTKANNAAAIGAKGMVVGNNVEGPPFSMSGSSETLYGVMVSQADGARFKSAGGPVSFTIQAVPGETDPTHRWLSGESDPAFGGAIRDMWNPNCYGDPGRVSDEEYHCDESDAGGVHSNSGVVNRTFAILVDGVDGQGTSGIGLDKAAWLFWHSQYNYLTPSSYFPDLADSLEASCEALKGVSFERVTLGNPQPDGSAGGVVDPAVVEGGMTDADCAKLTAAIAETELRLDPAEQCNFQPMLEQGAPVLNCGTGTTTKAAFSENFEDGLAGWTQDEVMVFADTETIPWEATDDAPADHPGTAAYAPDPQGGACNGGPDDITSRSGLISPAITMPAGTSPRLSFDHYVATEAHYDGGNVKYSVGGGDFKLVPADKYLFNAPEGELDAGSGPMGGEPVWSGTDGGQLGGSWGKTVVNLTGLANPGQSIRFRFDMGRDGCGGLDGWYVDNVAVEACEKVTTPTPTPAPAPVPSTTVAKVSPKLPDFGRDFTVIGKVRAEGLALAPRSIVIFKIDGERIGSRRLDDGRAVMTVRRNYGAGKHTLVAIYRGSDKVLGSRDKHRFTIQKR